MFFDEEDKRSFNWIARPTLKYGKFELNYNNNNYHKKRMDYMNVEISIQNIYALTEPIVERCKKAQDEIQILIQKQNTENISDCLKIVKKYRSSLRKYIFSDLQHIAHGEAEYDDYYNFSNEYCICVDGLLENLEVASSTEIKRILDINIKKCNNMYSHYLEARSNIENH